VVRREGGLWGVEHGEVAGLARAAGGGFEIRLAGGSGDGGDGGGRPTVLTADEVIGVVAGLDVRAATGAIARYWPEKARGIALHGAVPLVVVDPAAPPRALLGGGPEGGRRDG
jgi:hypothetical protein